MLLLGLPNIHNPLRADGLWSHLFGRHRKCACPTTECPMHRAGHPETVAWYAIPRNSGRYWGYYVGGGAPVKKGDPRGVHEGVWGWDWVGRAIQPKVELNWWHGRKYQGGAGAYKTDGPHFKHKK